MKAFIYLAEGFEEIEALATCDVLRRGGVETVLVKVDSGTNVSSAYLAGSNGENAAGQVLASGDVHACDGHGSEHKCRCVLGAHSIKVKCNADLTVESDAGNSAEVLPCSVEDIMVFPGGMPGARNLAECRQLMDTMKSHYAAGGRVAAICAAPGLVLGQMEVPAGTRFTCYDGFQQPLQARGGEFTPVGAVNDNRIITGRGPAYAIDFGLEILAELKGTAAAEAIRAGMFLN